MLLTTMILAKVKQKVLDAASSKAATWVTGNWDVVAVVAATVLIFVGLYLAIGD